jgi:voltage-gated potassium channel
VTTAAHQTPGLRERLQELLDHGHRPHSGAALLSRMIIMLALVDVCAMILDSIPDLHARHASLFLAVELFTAAVFALEYAVRLWSVASISSRQGVGLARARVNYVFSGLGLIDLLSFAPVALALLAGRHDLAVPLGMLPSLKLVRYSPAIRSLLSALHAERRRLIGCLVILIGVMLIFATLLYTLERDVQPDKFGSIPLAMWWSMVTLGTVGYGDVVPVTAAGKVVASFAIVCGFMMIALPVAIIAGAFASEVRRRDFIVTWGMLARVPLFSQLSAAEIGDIMRLLRAQTVEGGDVLVRRGDAASSMYFISAGEVEIALPTQSIRMTDGAFFGEIALLRQTRRTATVTARRKTNLLVLDLHDLQALMERVPAIAAHIETTARERLAVAPDSAKGDISDAELVQSVDDNASGRNSL